tara:strand:+ start:2115 stop:2504 length:390 start_codon:yes stop_codon:yes gene_type:complete
MKTTVTGTIVSIGETKEITQKFKKREIVIKTDAEPDKPWMSNVYGMELTQDRCDMADPFAPGERVTVEANVKGREWLNKEGQPKYFVSLDIWKISKGDGQESGPDGIVENFQEEAIRDMTPDQGDDLPF